jgi:dsDNA-specific endonuclease/ATPase MutS2
VDLAAEEATRAAAKAQQAEAVAAERERLAAIAAVPWKPSVGETVQVPKLGGTAVVSAIQKNKVQVEFGRMSLSVKMKDIQQA